MNTIDEKCLSMVFGDENTIFEKFDVDNSYPKEVRWLKENDYRVKLRGGNGFATEWRDWVDYDKSEAFIEDGKLHVNVYGIPDHINHEAVSKYFKKELDHRLVVGYGEFFETLPGCPMCVVVKHNGKEVIV